MTWFHAMSDVSTPASENMRAEAAYWSRAGFSLQTRVWCECKRGY